MGATFNTGYLENLILYNGSNNIGIGTSADATYKVTLGGSLLGTSALFSSGISAIGQEQAITFQRTTGTASDLYSFNADSASAYLYNNTTAKPLMTWAEGGNVGIGNTTNTWNGTTATAIQIGGSSQVISIAASSTFGNIIGGNTYYNSGFKYTTSNAAALILMDNNGDIYFRNAASGTAGNAITWNERLFISSGGNVGIGETSPSSKLHVVGTSLTNTFRITDAANYTIVMGYEGTGNIGMISTLGSTAKLALGTNSLARLTFDGSTGAATFSSTITAGQSLFQVSDTGVGTKTITSTFERTGASPSGSQREVGIVFKDGNNPTIVGGISGVRYNSGGNFYGGLNFYVQSVNATPATSFSNLTKALGIDYTGAATFSSSVTAGGDLNFTANDSAIGFASGAARFFTGGSERMRITSGGNVLIGTTTDNGRKLNVSGTGYFSGTLSTNKIENLYTHSVSINSNSTFTLISAGSINIRSNILVSVSIYWDSNVNAQRQYLLFLGATNTNWGTPNSAISVIASNDWSSGYVGAATFSIGGTGVDRSLQISVSGAATYNVTAYASVIVM